MEDRSLPLDSEQEPDPATQAFARLEGEMALVRRAVQNLATEKAEIDIPDYSNTLGEMAKRLVAIKYGRRAEIAAFAVASGRSYFLGFCTDWAPKNTE